MRRVRCEDVDIDSRRVLTPSLFVARFFESGPVGTDRCGYPRYSDSASYYVTAAKRPPIDDQSRQ